LRAWWALFIVQSVVAARRLLLVGIFLMFTMDQEAQYAQTWGAPLGWVQSIMFPHIPYKLRTFEHMALIALYLALRKREGKGPRVRPMRSALLLCAGSIVFFLIYGCTRGGDWRSASWQIYLLLAAVLCAFSLAATFTQPQHYVTLAKVVMWAAVYRAVMCWLYYFFYVRTLTDKLPEFLTSHDDTVIWTTSLLVLFLNMLSRNGMKTQLKSLLLVLLFLGAVLFNARRVAWVSLAMGLAFMVTMLPTRQARRRAFRIGVVTVPLLVLYVAVGWGQPGRIFKPLQSFQTVGSAESEDASTKARNVENLGLIATANANNSFLGTGWGHPYIEISSKYHIINNFELWQYIPHNSILGILAFSGSLGFFGFWLSYPTAMFLNVRIARKAKTPLARQMGLISACQMVICANQFYSDMGSFCLKSVYMLSFSYAIALRMPILLELWPAVRLGAKRLVREMPAATSTPKTQAATT
jgi:hypothetical protein